MSYTPVDHSEKECRWCGILFKPNTSHQNFCSKGCYKKYGKKFLGHSQRRLKPNKPQKETKQKDYKSFKKDKCQFCGFVPQHKCQLDVDHIDGNHNNNDPRNLQTLCANCHRLKTFLNGEGWYADK